MSSVHQLAILVAAAIDTHPFVTAISQPQAASYKKPHSVGRLHNPNLPPSLTAKRNPNQVPAAITSPTEHPQPSHPTTKIPEPPGRRVVFDHSTHPSLSRIILSPLKTPATPFRPSHPTSSTTHHNTTPSPFHPGQYAAPRPHFPTSSPLQPHYQNTVAPSQPSARSPRPLCVANRPVGDQTQSGTEGYA